MVKFYVYISPVFSCQVTYSYYVAMYVYTHVSFYIVLHSDKFIDVFMLIFKYSIGWSSLQTHLTGLGIVLGIV